MTPPADGRSRIVFLLDVDNTLLDNDQVTADLKRYLVKEVGAEREERYLGDLRGAPSRAGLCRLPRSPAALPGRTPARPSSAERVLLPRELPVRRTGCFRWSLDVVEHLAQWGPTIILSDGDVVFQPRKVERSGLFDAVEGRVLIYIHKEQELDDVERRFPADHYVLVDDKVRILTRGQGCLG